ncbi:MAG: glutamine synthetase III [Clostridia bacterium]|jgi:glutamine synthetase|nr:glutamine synthetase III [Clostridia bacterium]
MTKNVPELFGCMVFNEDVMKERLAPDVYESLIKTIETGKTIDASIATPVAAAMKDWAIEKGATHYTHWFQPLTGLTAEKHDSFLSPYGRSKIVMEFSGKELIKGESDASSFPSGGLRATFEARGYTAWDPGSYAFVKDGTLYIPTAFCSYTGEALDTKTPLLRSMDAISAQALRIVRLFGDTESQRINTTVGAEQEYFIIDKQLYDMRKDLLYTGRTLFGAHSPKGQELEDHYFGPLKTRINSYMTELDEELWKMGIYSKTKHNEAAPAQHELAPVYVSTNLAVDQNLLIMEYMKKIAERHGLVCLLHEKPYAGVNGSGKHNNWSISTDTGKNLLHAGKTPADNILFLLVLAAIVKAVDDYQDLLRVSVAHAGNDHRLGAAEAPPAILSIFVGEELDSIIDAIISGKTYEGVKAGVMDLGIPSIPTFRKDTTDRNRTSPFAFTGNKFEFRMLGSSQNIALPNVVLNTAVAESFRVFADELEGADDFNSAVAKLIKRTFTDHRRIIFDGNGYSYEWKKEAARRGLLNLESSVDAFKCFNLPKNVALFERHNVMSKVEIDSREDIFFENYSKIINIEALTMIEMASRDIIPAVNAYMGDLARGANEKEKLIPGSCAVERDIIKKLSALTYKAYNALEELLRIEKITASIPDNVARAESYHDNVIPAMETLREHVDAMEELTSSEYWPLPTYGDMMFKV